MKRRPTTPARKLSRADLALAKKLMGQIRDGKDIRARKARKLRAAIRANRYENNLKLQIALDRLLDQIVR